MRWRWKDGRLISDRTGALVLEATAIDGTWVTNETRAGRLISSAPEMLELLDRWTEWAAGDSPDFGTSFLTDITLPTCALVARIKGA